VVGARALVIAVARRGFRRGRRHDLRSQLRMPREHPV